MKAVIISTSAGPNYSFNRKIRANGRSARGVVVWVNQLCCSSMDIVTGDDQTLLVISEKGFGKRTKVSNTQVISVVELA